MRRWNPICCIDKNCSGFMTPHETGDYVTWEEHLVKLAETTKDTLLASYVVYGKPLRWRPAPEDAPADGWYWTQDEDGDRQMMIEIVGGAALLPSGRVGWFDPSSMGIDYIAGPLWPPEERE